MSEYILSEIAEVIDCEHKTAPQIDRSKYYSIRTTDISNGKIKFESANRVSEETYLEWIKRATPEPGDIILAREAPVGEVGWIKDGYKVCLGQRTVLIKVNHSEVSNRFLLYYLVNPDTKYELQVRSAGSVVEHLNMRDIRNFKILLPPLPEQKAIAAVLSSLDDKIDLLHRQNKTLEAMAETLFRQWFIEEAQEDWEDKSLGELVTITSSKRIFYSEYVNTGVPFYRSKEIIELSISGSTKSELYIAEERFNDIQKRFGSPIEGDILLTSVGTLGVPYRVKNNDRFYFKDGNLTWFRDFGTIPSIIIFCWLKSNIGKEQLESITIGSTQPALTISGLKEIQLIIPPQELMKDIEVKLTHIYNKVDFNQSQIQALEKLRDTLLPKLMSGEVRVSY